MKNFKDLTDDERAQLLSFPAYVSLLASTSGNGLDKQEKDAAVKLSHIKTFSSDPQLKDFYKQVEENFEKKITHLDAQLPHGKKERKEAIMQELHKLDKVLKQLDPALAKLFKKSMESFRHHVSKAHQNVLEYFILPLPIEGITD
ncbi:MAG: hypothetical protein KGO81_00885 [Bacteroidota bacterium]|nr:hypothetical protein [Bacteroidota bacterium]